MTQQQLNDLRREVCREAWRLIRLGYGKSEAFRKAWETVKK
jgi:hypothetical protein